MKSVLIKRYSLSLVTAALLAVSCTTIKDSSTADSVEKINSAKKILIIKPKIKLYELSVGGVNTEKEDWTNLANANAVNVLRDKLISMGKEVIVIDSDDAEYKADTKDLLGIYETVQNTVRENVLGNDYSKFPEKVKNFKYWSGDTKALLEKFNADYVLAIYGFGQIESSGRQATRVAGAVIGVLTGVTVIQSGGYSVINMGALDKDGMLIWFGQNNPEESIDLRETKDLKNITDKMFEKITKPKKKK